MELVAMRVEATTRDVIDDLFFFLSFFSVSLLSLLGEVGAVEMGYEGDFSWYDVMSY